MRPDWTIERYNDIKINLSNNVCYDSNIQEQVNTLLKTRDFNFRQYPNEYIVYNAISKNHKINLRSIAIGHGLGELITRILKLRAIKKLSIITPTWQMVEAYSNIMNINYINKLDFSANALYVANPSGVTGTCMSRDEILHLLDKFELVIVDEAYGEFAQKTFSVLDMAPDMAVIVLVY